MSEIQDIFKVPIYQTHLKDIDNKSLAKQCIDFSKKDKGRVVSNVGGYQSNNLQNVKFLSSLVSSIHTACTTFNKDFDLKGLPTLNEMWMNISGYKDNNQVHNHGANSMSGVYYVQTPPKCGNIMFNHPAYDLVSLSFNNKMNNFNNYNSPRWFLPAEAGLLYLFPGYLNHSVEPNMNKTTKRISISFNVFFK